MADKNKKAPPSPGPRQQSINFPRTTSVTSKSPVTASTTKPPGFMAIPVNQVDKNKRVSLAPSRKSLPAATNRGGSGVSRKSDFAGNSKDFDKIAMQLRSRSVSQQAKPMAKPAYEGPPEFELLYRLHHVFLKRVDKLPEGFPEVEATSLLNCFGNDGNRIYFAGGVHGRSMCHTLRSFMITLYDSRGTIILTIDRPHLMFAGVTLEVKQADGQLLGRIIQEGAYSSIFQVKDNNNNIIMKIIGPAGDCCNRATNYAVFEFVGGGAIGFIGKLYSGIPPTSPITTEPSNEDIGENLKNFGVEFPVELEVKWKVLMLAGMFMIDMLYFET